MNRIDIICFLVYLDSGCYISNTKFVKIVSLTLTSLFYFCVVIISKKNKQILYIYFSFVQCVIFGLYFLVFLSRNFIVHSVFFLSFICIYTYCDECNSKKTYKILCQLIF